MKEEESGGEEGVRVDGGTPSGCPGLESSSHCPLSSTTTLLSEFESVQEPLNKMPYVHRIVSKLQSNQNPYFLNVKSI